jgi:hypothetical protein
MADLRYVFLFSIYCYTMTCMHFDTEIKCTIVLICFFQCMLCPHSLRLEEEVPGLAIGRLLLVPRAVGAAASVMHVTILAILI